MVKLIFLLVCFRVLIVLLCVVLWRFFLLIVKIVFFMYKFFVWFVVRFLKILEISIGILFFFLFLMLIFKFFIFCFIICIMWIWFVMVCGGLIWLFVFGECGGFGEGGWLFIKELFLRLRVKMLLLRVVNICF